MATASAQAISPEPVNVLVVDDRAENRLALASVLSGPGYRIIEASSGPEALRRLLENDFAVLLLDVVMPEMNGFELAELVRQRNKTATIPIVFLTGHATDIDLVYRGYRAGAVDYLVKPLVPEMVRAKVAVFAQLYRQRKHIEEQAARLLEAERRTASLQLLELRLKSERRFRSLADAIPQILWVASTDGTVEYFNQQWFAYTGLPPNEESWRSAVHPDDLPRCRAAWERANVAESTGEVEFRLRATDGSYRWHLGRAVPERDQAGAVVSWIGTFTDIETQKQTQEAQERAYREAADAVRARDEFLSVASHELRTPLSSLQLLIEMLLLPPKGSSPPRPLPDWLRPKLESASRQTKRLARLITELLEVSRITTGRLTLEREQFDLASLGSEVVAHFGVDATRAGSAVTLHAPEPVIGKWDRFRIEQVLTNLLSNAIKFGDGKRIEVSVTREGGSARLSVRDHGIGISQCDIARIFERFERAVPVRAYGGMGLGLFIARQVVDAHGGTIRVDSEPNAGSTFTVFLPFEPPKEQPLALEPAEGTELAAAEGPNA